MSRNGELSFFYASVVIATLAFLALSFIYGGEDFDKCTESNSAEYCLKLQ